MALFPPGERTLPPNMASWVNGFFFDVRATAATAAIRSITDHFTNNSMGSLRSTRSCDSSFGEFFRADADPNGQGAKTARTGEAAKPGKTVEAAKSAGQDVEEARVRAQEHDGDDESDMESEQDQDSQLMVPKRRRIESDKDELLSSSDVGATQSSSSEAEDSDSPGEEDGK